MHYRNYGIAQAYTKGCTSKMYHDHAVTKDYVLPFDTLAPTSNPSSAAYVMNNTNIKAAVKKLVEIH